MKKVKKDVGPSDLKGSEAEVGIKVCQPGVLKGLPVDGLRLHPAISDIPTVYGVSWKDFLADVKERGIQEPIVVQKGGILLDGQLRLKAAKEGGFKTIPARIVDLNPEEQVHYIFTSALGRRHLTDDQRAVLAHWYRESVLSPEAKKDRSTKANMAKKYGKGSSPTPTLGNKQKVDTRTVAARMFGISRKKVEKVSELPRELQLEVLKGNLKLHEAVKKIAAQKKRQEIAKFGKEVPADKRWDLFCEDSITGMADKKRFPDNSVDLVFSDPPYNKEAIPCYSKMMQEIPRILKPGGSLVVYYGAYYLPEVLNSIRPKLTWWWQLAIKLDASETIKGKSVFQGWKGLLWFCKGGMPKKHPAINDIIVGSKRPEKLYHVWEQSVDDAKHVIEKLTDVGDMVLDPFAGSGTSLIAAVQLHRRAKGFEIDPKHYAVAHGRILKETQEPVVEIGTAA
ncbi:ParB N-terminal domain-containing protein [bacterium]|nr:ParB N-terminal domain-containing protein [bacterium]